MRSDLLTLETVSADLARRFRDAPYDVIRDTAEECLGQWPDARISDYVPILATKCARERLAARGFQSRVRRGETSDFARGHGGA